MSSSCTVGCLQLSDRSLAVVGTDRGRRRDRRARCKGRQVVVINILGRFVDNNKIGVLFPIDNSRKYIQSN